MKQPLYRCPILESFGDYDRDFTGQYDPRHLETLEQMQAHLRQNKWTESEIEAWTKKARPIQK
jgi:hypothetical protein